MARLRYNGLSNSLGASLTSGGTTITFASKLTYAGGDVPTISGSDYIPLSILDADGLCAEVVHLTAYTSAATTGTIARGKEDTTGAAHDSGAVVVNGPTAAESALAYGELNAASGGSQTVTAATWTEIQFATSAAEQGGISVSTANDDITVPRDGVYLIHAFADVAPTGAGTLTGLELQPSVNGTGDGINKLAVVPPAVLTQITGSIMMSLSANDAVSLEIRATGRDIYIGQNAATKLRVLEMST